LNENIDFSITCDRPADSISTLTLNEFGIGLEVRVDAGRFAVACYVVHHNTDGDTRQQENGDDNDAKVLDVLRFLRNELLLLSARAGGGGSLARIVGGGAAPACFVGHEPVTASVIFAVVGGGNDTAFVVFAAGAHDGRKGHKRNKAHLAALLR